MGAILRSIGGFEVSYYRRAPCGIAVCCLRPRRTLRLRGLPGLGFRLLTLMWRLAARRGVTLGELRPRPFGLLRMPASGLNGGVGNVILPTFRPCPTPPLTTWPRACAPDSIEKASNRTPAVAIRISCLFNVYFSSFLPRSRGRHVGDAVGEF